MYMYLYFHMYICAQCHRIDGNVPWSERQGLMDSFNTGSIDDAFVSCTCMLRYVLQSVARFNTGPIDYVLLIRTSALQCALQYVATWHYRLQYVAIQHYR